MWDNSEEDFAIRKVEHLNRVAFVERLQSSDVSASKSLDPYESGSDVAYGFWDPSYDDGLQAIFGAGKRD